MGGLSGENMKDAVKFKWEGVTEYEDGIAFYEIGTTTYLLGFPSFRAANKMHMAMLDAYREGYEDGVRGVKAAVQSALSKLPE
jgi:hypothetical protein